MTASTYTAGTSTSARRAGAPFATTVLQAARRTVLQFLRTPQLLITGTINGALYLFMFRYVIGGAMNTGSATKYVDFLAPGFFTTIVLWNGMPIPAGVAEDAHSGVYDRLRSLPIPRGAVMLGRSLADTAMLSWAVLVTALFSLAVGFRFHGSVGEVALAFAIVLAATFALSWAFITLGLFARNAQAAQGLSMMIIPLVFISSAYVPVRSMPGWLQPIAKNQPITVITNAVRSLMLGGADAAGAGHSTTYWVVLSLVWCAAIFVVLGGIAVSRFGRAQ